MKDFLNVAITAAKQASFLLIKKNSITNLSFKQINDYLTDCDIESENLIKKAILERFPDHNIAAEESDFENRSSEYTWHIDPISATANFAHGLPHFGVSVSLQKGETFIVGVVCDPTTNDLWCATKNGGAFQNEERIHVSTVTELSKALLIVEFGNRENENINEGLAYYAKLFALRNTLRKIGSVAIELCHIASGKADGFVGNFSDSFALPAGNLIIEEAGGRVSDIQGNPYAIDSTSILVSNGHIHDNLIHILNA